jgi:hypothetical protein
VALNQWVPTAIEKSMASLPKVTDEQLVTKITHTQLPSSTPFINGQELLDCRLFGDL